MRLRALLVCSVIVGCGKLVTYEPPPEKRVADVEHQSLDEAKALAAKGDIRSAHDKLGQVKQDSPLRSTPEFIDIENKWAQQQIDAADKERDKVKKIALLRTVAESTSVSGELRARANQKINEATPDPAIPPPDYGYDRAAAIERIQKAQQLIDQKKYREARDVLIGPVTSRKCAPEEEELLIEACYLASDRECGAILADAGIIDMPKPKGK